jgi:hypothetical protein
MYFYTKLHFFAVANKPQYHIFSPQEKYNQNKEEK